jgi:hypothetical protein
MISRETGSWVGAQGRVGLEPGRMFGEPMGEVRVEENTSAGELSREKSGAPSASGWRGELAVNAGAESRLARRERRVTGGA